MNPAFKYGRRLTQREFERAVVALHGRFAIAGTESDDERTRRAELDLTIDYRLGTDFPQSRRNDLWEVQRSIEKKRLRIMFSWLTGALGPQRLSRHANGVARFVVERYATVLPPDELDAYFGTDEVQHPSLPICD